ncbi:SEL1-like repeat protein [Desulfocicer niacini]
MKKSIAIAALIFVTVFGIFYLNKYLSRKQLPDSTIEYLFQEGNSPWTKEEYLSVQPNKEKSDDEILEQKKLFQKAVDTWKKQDFASAQMIWEQLAEDGHGGSAFYLAESLLNDTPPKYEFELERIVNLYETSCKLGVTQGCIAFGAFTEKNDRNTEKAIAIYELAARLGDYNGLVQRKRLSKPNEKQLWQIIDEEWNINANALRKDATQKELLVENSKLINSYLQKSPSIADEIIGKRNVRTLALAKVLTWKFIKAQLKYEFDPKKDGETLKQVYNKQKEECCDGGNHRLKIVKKGTERKDAGDVITLPSKIMVTTLRESDFVLLSDGETNHFSTIYSINHQTKEILLADPWPREIFLLKPNLENVKAKLVRYYGHHLVKVRFADMEKVLLGYTSIVTR